MSAGRGVTGRSRSSVMSRGSMSCRRGVSGRGCLLFVSTVIASTVRAVREAPININYTEFERGEVLEQSGRKIESVRVELGTSNAL